MADCFVSRHLKSADETAAMAKQVSKVLQAGDVLLLEGSLGAGKSHFARTAIQERLGYAEDVPSPTFTLVQVYEAEGLEIWHCDLYRLTDPESALELGLDEAFDTAACLIEWPSRLEGMVPRDAVTLSLQMCKADGERDASFSGTPSDFRTRLEAALND